MNSTKMTPHERNDLEVMTFNRIGTIHSPFKSLQDIPIQASNSNFIGNVEVFEKYAQGLEGIGEFSHVILLYYFHEEKEERLKTRPYLDDKEHGIYSTRHPHRPNHIGISTVKLLRVNGCILAVEGIDVLDGTPLLDIKPYVSAFDNRTNVKNGWLGGKI
jgi:tRNA (adenine37-N6)-methyltransferase